MTHSNWGRTISIIRKIIKKNLYGDFPKGKEDPAVQLITGLNSMQKKQLELKHSGRVWVLKKEK